VSKSKPISISKHENKVILKARRLIDKSDYQQAYAELITLIEGNPDLPEALYLLGICLINMSKYLDAVTYLARASEIQPENPEYYSMLGIALSSIGSTGLAKKNFKKSLAIDEGNISALLGLGDIYFKEKNYQLAKELYTKTVNLKPSFVAANMKLALALSNLDSYEEALVYAEKGLKREPKNASSIGILARIHLVGGHIDKAVEHYQKAVELDPTNGVVYNDLVSARKIRDKKDPIILQMIKALKSSMPSSDRQLIHFALGQAYNDSQQWDLAFENFQKGNVLVPTTYNQRIVSKFIKDIKKTIKSSTFEKFKDVGNYSGSPVFIVGMPRSGSTLIDQVLISHSQVFSVGESAALSTVIGELKNKSENKLEYPFLVKDLTKNDLALLSGGYLDIIQEDSGNAKKIINKMLFHFLHLGLIALLFPNAKIIHSVRNPLDTCLSCFFTDFESNGTEKEWTSSLDNIGFFYRKYFEIMSYWKETLSIPILDIYYEDMVDDLEHNARKILDFCDLDWEQQCLEFYKSKRSVQTASVSQVRQPIYKSSVSRWPSYAKHLGPLVEQLGDIVKDDYEQLRELGCEFKVKKGLLGKLFS